MLLSACVRFSLVGASLLYVIQIFIELVIESFADVLYPSFPCYYLSYSLYSDLPTVEKGGDIVCPI